VGKAVARILLTLAIAIAGGAIFHIYYRSLPDTDRCRWDHPLDKVAMTACRHAAAANVSGYSAEARGQLNRLIDKISH